MSRKDFSTEEGLYKVIRKRGFSFGMYMNLKFVKIKRKLLGEKKVFNLNSLINK